jgi:hypothetical protein
MASDSDHVQEVLIPTSLLVLVPVVEKASCPKPSKYGFGICQSQRAKGELRGFLAEVGDTFLHLNATDKGDL